MHLENYLFRKTLANLSKVVSDTIKSIKNQIKVIQSSIKKHHNHKFNIKNLSL